MSAYVERFWAVHWDLPGRRVHEPAVILHPCAHLVLSSDVGAEVHGPRTAVSRHPLTGSGRVFGARFRPGGLRALTGESWTRLADWTASAASVFGPEVEELNTAAMSGSDEAAIESVSSFLGRRRPAREDPRYELLLAVVEVVRADPRITRVDQVAARFDMSPRGLQRLFGEYVGLGPKSVIRRYRLHDAAQRLAEHPRIGLARFAVELGWSDQAHFTRDFKDAVGTPPAEYAAQCASAGAVPIAPEGAGPVLGPVG